MEEYNPLLHARRMLAYWWLIPLAALLGGLGGLLFSLAHAPVYEARAVFFVSVDLDRIQNPLKPLTQMDEDLALASTEGALLNPAVIQYVLDEASKQSIPLNRAALLKDSVIEREGTFWNLRFHSTNPSQAQAVVNTWAAKGYELMLDMQNKNQIPAYVIYHSPDLATTPTTPVNYNRYRLILAGGVAGIIIGILLADRLSERLLPGGKKA